MLEDMLRHAHGAFNQVLSNLTEVGWFLQETVPSRILKHETRSLKPLTNNLSLSNLDKLDYPPVSTIL